VLTVSRLAPREGVEGVELLRVAASAEMNSRHPVARAVAEMGRRAKLRLVEPQEFKEVAGRGVVARIDGAAVHVGRAAWVSDPATGVGLNEADLAFIAQVAGEGSEAEGLSVLYVARDGRLLGWIGLEDNARAEAPAAMDRLRDQGLKRLVILTGDRASVAKRVAAQMHIPEYKAEVLPHEKLEMVDELKDKGHRVAVVGDGVNDAPALAAGDISIAMGAAGSDVAIHSASIALMNSNLNRIPFLIDLSRRTINVIRINMAIGACFIVVFMTLAGAGYVTPIFAALLHVASGLAVIFNSARLVRAGERVEAEEAEYYAQRQKAGERQRRRDEALRRSA
jgi:Cd2+/Zn2+-exporting ATPase